MLGIPIESIMSQFNPAAPGTPQPTSAMSQIQAQATEKQKVEQKKVKTESQQPKINQEQQAKLLQLEKQLQDPMMQMLMAQGLVNPAALCGLDNETAKLLGLAPATGKNIDPKSLAGQPGMTPEMLALMQFGMNPAGLGNPTGQPGTSTPKSKSAKKRPATDNGSVKNEKPDSRPASRSSLASSQRAPTPNEAKKRKSEEKVDINTLPPNMKIPLVMADGTKMSDGIPNKELKGLLESNPQIKVDYEVLEAKLERSRPKKSTPVPEKAPATPPVSQTPPAAGPDLAAMGITPEVMAQLMAQGIDRKTIMNIPGFGGQKTPKSMRNDPAQQKVQLINLRTFQKLDKKKCPELCSLETFLKKNPDYFVATEAKEFVLKHPKYFPRTLYQRIQPDMNDPLAQLNALSDPKMMQALMMQAQMDPKAMNVLQAQQAMNQMNDPKLMAQMLGIDKNAQLAMAAQMGGMDAKMLQAMGLGGLDPKLLGMDPKMLGQLGMDPKMLSALGVGGLDQKSQQNALLQQQQQLQQLAMLGMDPKALGIGGMDPKALQAALGMGGLDPKQLAQLGLDQNTLMALMGGGLDQKSLNALQQQQKQADIQAQAMAQMMGGSLDQKYLASLGLAGVPGLGAQSLKEPKKERKTPTPKKTESADQDGEKPERTETPKSSNEKPEGDAAENAENIEKGSDNPDSENPDKTEENGEGAEKSEDASDKPEGDQTAENEAKSKEGSKASSPKPGSSKSETPQPSTPKPTTVPQMDQQALQALKSLANADPKTLQGAGLDANVLKQLGLSGQSTPDLTKSRSPSTSMPMPFPKIPGMEGLDTETLKALANGDPSAMQKIMATGALGGPNPLAALSGAPSGNPLLGGVDPRLLDERTLMALASSGGQGAKDAQLLKSLGLDQQHLQMMQQQELLKQQQQLAQQMGMLGGMGGMGGIDQKTLQMLGMGGLDPKMLNGAGLDQQAQLMAQQQALGLLGGYPPMGLDANMMSQILGKSPGTPNRKAGSTPKKASTPVSHPQTSAANLDFLKQQEQLLQLSLSGGLKPEQLMQSPELAMLAAQMGSLQNPALNPKSKPK